jgi:plastocyanin
MLRRKFLAVMMLPGALPGRAIGLPGLASGAPRPNVQITITGIAFLEVKQPLIVGDTIEWINKDVVAHTATAKNKDFRLVIEANATATLVLKKPGTVDFYCEYHPNMTGRLVIRERK